MVLDIQALQVYIVFSQFPGNLLEETLIGHALGCAPILLQAFLMIHSKTFCTSGISHTQTADPRLRVRTFADVLLPTA